MLLPNQKSKVKDDKEGITEIPNLEILIILEGIEITGIEIEPEDEIIMVSNDTA